MSFQTVYRAMNDPIGPSPALLEKTLARTACRPRRLRLAAAAAAVILSLCTAVPAAAAVSDPFYEALYFLAPAAAQFFQPVRISCESGGVTMEVISVRVEGDTAQACIALTGDAVDGPCDLFDSYHFHIPSDMACRCESLGFDESSRTAFFLCAAETMDGSPIPTGGKLTFSLDCFLTGKEVREDLSVDLPLADCARPAETVPAGKPGDRFAHTGGGGFNEETLHLLDTPFALLPRTALAEPAKGLTVTAAGYAEGLFRIQICRGNASLGDNHCQLWLEDSQGNRKDDLGSLAFVEGWEGPDRLDYTEFLFDVSPEELPDYTIRGNFRSFGNRVDGNWKVTFPLKNS